MAIGDSDASMSLWDLRPLDAYFLLTQPLARAVPAHLATLDNLRDLFASTPDLDPRAAHTLAYAERLLRHRFRADVEVETGFTIQAGEFDIEIEG
jgi:hypothetical protein